MGIGTAGLILGDDLATTTIDGSKVVLSGNSQVDGFLTVSANAAGEYDVTFYGTSTANHMVWDQSANKLVITGNAGTNALEIASGDVLIKGNITVGQSNAGYNVTFYGSSGGAKMEWAPSTNKLIVTGVSGSEAFRIAAGNAIIAAGSLAVTNPSTLGQIALTVTQSTTTQDIVHFVGQGDQTLSFELDTDGNLVIESSTRLTIKTLNDQDIILDTGTGQVRIPSGKITVKSGAVLTEPGQQILRGVIPIFGFDLPIQTATTSYVRVSRTIQTYPFPPKASGTERVYKAIIRYTDNLPTASTTDWHVATTTGQAYPDSAFTLSGCNDSSLASGTVAIATTTIPTDLSWWLEVKSQPPYPDNKIRIFQIFLAAFDQLP